MTKSWKADWFLIWMAPVTRLRELMPMSGVRSALVPSAAFIERRLR